eukprot:scaffold82260_cov75-Phaeocystis_antarctica.AAC.2
MRPKVVASPLPFSWRPKADDVFWLKAQVGRDTRMHVQRLPCVDTPVYRSDGVVTICSGAAGARAPSAMTDGLCFASRCYPEAGKVFRLVKHHFRRAPLPFEGHHC